MSFASEIREEICKADINEVCCARAELVGMVCFGASAKSNEIKIRTENVTVAERFCKLINFLYKIDLKISSTESGIYFVQMLGDDVIRIIRDMRLGGVPVHIDKEIIRNECCKSAILRGMFLGGGSMIDPLKGYHLEFVTSRFSVEKDLKPVFEFFDLYPKTIIRNGTNVYYIKESQQIENILAAIGAHNKMTDFLNVTIERDIRNKANRRANFEYANVIKVSETALKQQLAIKKIVLEHGWQSMAPELADVAKIRINDSTISLAGIAEKVGVSKSCVNHRMRKILELADMDR